MNDLGNKKIFSRNLTHYMETKKIDRKKLCEDLGLKYSTVSEWINAKKYPRIDKIEIIAEYFGISKSDLIEEKSSISTEELISRFDNIRPIQRKKFPMLGEIACGEPIFADEVKEHYVMADMDIHADFCLRAKGDSMINARIYDGDIVFIREQPTVDNGEIAAVIINNEATLKKVYYYPEKSRLVLYPENPAFEPLIYTGDELEEIRILGKAVYFMSTV